MSECLTCGIKFSSKYYLKRHLQSSKHLFRENNDHTAYSCCCVLIYSLQFFRCLYKFCGFENDFPQQHEYAVWSLFSRNKCLELCKCLFR